MIRTVTIKQVLGESALVVVYCLALDYEGDREAVVSKVYRELDFGVAQAIEDFLQTGEVSEYTN